MLSEDQQRVLGVELKVLLTIYGRLQIEDGTWRMRMNHKLHEMLGESPIVHTANNDRLGWDVGGSPVKMVLENESLGP